MPGGPGCHGIGDAKAIRPRGEQHDGWSIIGRGDPPRGRHAIEQRHRKVHEDQVRPQLGRQLHRLGTIGGFADDLEGTGADQKPDNALANARVVVDYQNPDRWTGVTTVFSATSGVLVVGGGHGGGPESRFASITL